LTPRSGCRAEIDTYFGVLEEVIFLVDLDKLEGGTRAVAFLFGEFVPAIRSVSDVKELKFH